MAIMTGDLQTSETYDSARAVQAQRDYCVANNLPLFAPYDGRCFRCHRNIYSAEVMPNGFVCGFSVEHAASNFITGCPFCHASFCD